MKNFAPHQRRAGATMKKKEAPQIRAC